MRLRASLAQLLGVVAVGGVSLAALHRADQTWAAAMFTAAAGAILVAILGAAFGRGPTRAFCAGFALFGAAYLLLAYGEGTTYLLLTTRLLQAAIQWPGVWRAPLREPAVAVPGGPGAVLPGQPIGEMERFVRWNDSSLTAFESVGHCVFALLAAVAGGLVARHFRARGRPDGSSPRAGLPG